MSRRSAYYSRNNSYSRSYNAERAEAEGRFPRTRAAAHLGLSVAAFDAARRAIGYVTTEWHHVGKYANPVDYYDAEELSSNWRFWAAAAAAYKSKAKRAELEAKAFAVRKEGHLDDCRLKWALLAHAALEKQRAASRHGGKTAKERAAELEARYGRVAKPFCDLGTLTETAWQESAATYRVLKHCREELEQHADYKHRLRMHQFLEQEEDRAIRKHRLIALEPVAAAVVPVVPQNHPGRNFRTLADTPVIATALRQHFRKDMQSAKMAAAEHGYNAVTPVNLGGCHGNGWIPAVIAA